MAELEADRARLSNLVASLNAENDQLQARSTDALKAHQQALQLADQTQRQVAGADPDVQEAMEWKAKKEKLKQLFRDNPDWWVPEMSLVTESEWLDAARYSDLTSKAGIAASKQDARAKGERKYIQGIAAAVVRFMDANNQKPPESLRQALPFFQGPGEPTWIDRYEIVQRGPVTNLPPGVVLSASGWKITQAREFDPEGDVRLGMELHNGRSGFVASEHRTEPAQ